jgi:C2 domain
MGKTEEDPNSPVLRHAGKQNADRIGANLVEKTEKYRQKALSYRPTKQDTQQEQQKDPPGGYDATPLPHAPPGYTLKITFHRADNLPFADLKTLSSDPYMLAVLKTGLPQRHKSDPDLRIRIPTIHRNTNPVWNTEWVVANVPASGFFLKCRLFDEDPADHDDRLGNVHVRVDSIGDHWEGFREQKFKIKKRVGSKRAYLFRSCAALLSRDIEMSGDVVISVENLGRTQDEEGGRAYTIGPLAWSRHYSPLIGRLTGTKNRGGNKNGKPDVERYKYGA